MKRVILTFLTPFIAFIFVSIAGCFSGDTSQPAIPKVSPDTAKTISSADTLTEWEKQAQVTEQNKAISKSQEIPTGTENFEKMVSYIWKHGFTITGGPKEIPCGKQYTFFDSKKNRHAYLAIKTDSTGAASMTGKVQNIYTYGYKQGIKDQDHFFPYNITAISMSCPILEVDGTWEGVKEATFGYNEFLKKVSK